MEEKKFNPGNSVKEHIWEASDDYFMVEDEDGVLRCSCGRELVKMDEETYKCPGGYPIYRVKDGNILLDKFGNLMMKKDKKHES